MFPLLLILSVNPLVLGQLTVGGWFFPVSVPPPDPRDNTVYDEDISFPEAEPVNITHQEIKDYYEKDKLEKWNNQKTNLQAVLRKNLDFAHRHSNDGDHTTSTTHDPLEISKSKRFPPDSGVVQFIPTPTGLGNLAINEEPVITMSMSPIETINKPEEILTNSITEIESPPISSTTEQITSTRIPFIYALPKKKSYDDPLSSIEKEKDMIKLKKDVFRLRNEMNLVKALLNKLYRKSYKKQRDFLMQKTRDATRLSAIQAEKNDNDWAVFRRTQTRA